MASFLIVLVFLVALSHPLQLTYHLKRFYFYTYSDKNQQISPSSEVSLVTSELYSGLFWEKRVLYIFFTNDVQFVKEDESPYQRQKYHVPENEAIVAFSEKYIVASGAKSGEIINIEKAYRKNRDTLQLKKNYFTINEETKPILTAAAKSLAVTIYEQIEGKLYNIHFFSLSDEQVESLSYKVDVRPLSLTILEEKENQNKVYTAYPTTNASLIRVNDLTRSTFLEYGAQSENVLIKGSNCASKLAVSNFFLVAACPQANIITVVNLSSREQVCSLSGPSDTIFGQSLALFQHQTQDLEGPRITTVFLSGYQNASNLHFITQIHILPSRKKESVQCFLVDNPADYLVSHSRSISYESAQLEVGISKTFILILLKAPDGLLYQSRNKRTLYSGRLSSFYPIADHTCPPEYFYNSTILGGICSPCKEAVDPVKYPLKALIKEAVCCASPTQHGSSCLECKEYMPSIQSVLPQNSGWVNGEVCTHQCLSGYSEFEATGLCESLSYLNAVYTDSCFSRDSCQVCNIQSCYVGECEPGDQNRLKVVQSISEHCGRRINSFCGWDFSELNLYESQGTVVLEVEGENGLKAKKGLLCEWGVLVKGKNGKYSIKAETIGNQNVGVSLSQFQNVQVDLFVVNQSNQMILLKPNSTLSFTTTKEESQIFVKSLFYQGSSQNLVRIMFQKQLSPNQYLPPQNPQQSQHPVSPRINQQTSPDSKKAITIVLLIILSLFILAGLFFLIRCILKRRRVRTKLTQSNDVPYVEKQNETQEEVVCSICNQWLSIEGLTSECQHSFHARCLQDWKKEHSQCPACEYKLNI